MDRALRFSVLMVSYFEDWLFDREQGPAAGWAEFLPARESVLAIPALLCEQSRAFHTDGLRPCPLPSRTSLSMACPDRQIQTQPDPGSRAGHDDITGQRGATRGP